MKFATLGIRGKLILVFILIKVLPLIFLAWFAWDQVADLGTLVSRRTTELAADTREVVGQMGDLATQDSIVALDVKSREAIERLTTDTARQVAAFLYDRDRDVLQAARLRPDEDAYRRFLAPLSRPVILHGPWVLDEATDTWTPVMSPHAPSTPAVAAINPDNAKDFHYRPPEDPGIVETRPLYHEMTFVDLNGRELVKVSQSDLLSGELRDVSDPANTFCKAETYFKDLKRLKPGEIYVSEVIGPYVPGYIIGPYTRARADKAGIPFEPEKSGYAGKENPVGKRFAGIIRWAAPVIRNGAIVGYVTLALDHTHVMEFTDHVIPTERRYSPISDAAAGNYAFIWDYKGRNISHPRDYFICGYDPETGKPAVPWLDTELYAAWRDSGRDIDEFLKTVPTFHEQSLKKSPAPELTGSGLVALDGRYLNFAPQCTGWHNLTSSGGSGSFVIFWSGLWKLTTAAAIPYHTGRYGDHPRGFGYVTIGANVHEFHRAATETAAKMEKMVAGYEQDLQEQNARTQTMLGRAVEYAARSLGLSTAAMVFIVILIAVIMASAITRKITSIIDVVRRFREGDMDARIETDPTPEMAQLGNAYNEMAESVKQSFATIQAAEVKYRGMVEHAAAGIFRSTPDGRFVSVNPAMARMLGYGSPGEMLESIQDIAGQIYHEPAERRRLLDLFEDRDEIRDFVFRGVRKDGRTGLFTVTVRKMVDPETGEVHLEGMMLDISDREEKERAERARNMAEASNQAKSEFLARMSHEIRTPMNAVVGVADLLEEYDLDEDQRVLVDLLKTSGSNLLTLIDDILDLSKIDAGKITIRQAPFRPRAEMASTVSMLAHRAYEKGLELEYEVDDEIPTWVMGDAPHIRQVLVNLLSNAIKFTDAGEILIRLRSLGIVQDQAMMECTVSDTGIGIPAQDMDRIFESFGQADSSLTRRHGGTGLGLAISKRLVEIMGGAIRAESEEGRGSTFVFSLPLVEPEENMPDETESNLKGKSIVIVAAHPLARTRLVSFCSRLGGNAKALETGEEIHKLLESGQLPDLVLMDALHEGDNSLALLRDLFDRGIAPGAISMMLRPNDLHAGSTLAEDMGLGGYLVKPVGEPDLRGLAGSLADDPAPASPSGETTAPPGQGMRILLVDDTEEVRFIVAHYLEDHPYELDVAKDGKQGVDKFRTGRYDAVLLDMQMPVLDGYSAVAIMRNYERENGLPRTPVIALTAHAMPEDRRKCLDSGCDEYLSKPLRKTQLLDMLARMSGPVGNTGFSAPRK